VYIKCSLIMFGFFDTNKCICQFTKYIGLCMELAWLMYSQNVPGLQSIFRGDREAEKNERRLFEYSLLTILRDDISFDL
jgi:hypothetical protein